MQLRTDLKKNLKHMNKTENSDALQHMMITTEG